MLGWKVENRINLVLQKRRPCEQRAKVARPEVLHRCDVVTLAHMSLQCSKSFSFLTFQFSTFQLFNFSTFQLFDFSTFWLFNCLTFQLFDFSPFWLLRLFGTFRLLAGEGRSGGLQNQSLQARAASCLALRTAPPGRGHKSGTPLQGPQLRTAGFCWAGRL